MCLIPQTGKGCSIEGMQIVTEANFCPWSVQTPTNSSTKAHNTTAYHSGEEGGQDHVGGGTYSEDDEEREEEEKAKSEAACNRMQDFHSLVERAEFEHNKEMIEGHIRSNSLVFNTFIFLQASWHHDNTLHAHLCGLPKFALCDNICLSVSACQGLHALHTSGVSRKVLVST